MNKQILLIALSFIAFSGKIQAQELEIKWGESFNSTSEIEKILGVSGDTLVTFSMEAAGNSIEHYDVKNNYSEKKSIQFGVPRIEGIETGLLNIILRDGKIEAFIYSFDKMTTKTFRIYSQILSLDCKELKPMTELYSSNIDEEELKNQVVDMCFSQDQSKALIFFDRSNLLETKFYSDIIVFNFKDENKQPIIEKHEFEMRSNKSESVIFHMKHTIDNSGNHFSISEKREITNNKISNYILSIRGIDPVGNEIGDAEITDSEHVFISPKITFLDNQFIVVGNYGSIPKKGKHIDGYSGLFTAKLNNDLSIEKLKLTKFTDNFLLNFYSEKKIQSMNKEGIEILIPDKYRINELIIHPNGTMTFLSEFYLVAISDAGAGQTTNHTVYGNIIYSKLNLDGEILTSEIIKKNQSSACNGSGFENSGYTGIYRNIKFEDIETVDKKKKYWSYAIFNDGNNLYVFFNDHPQNIKNASNDEIKTLNQPNKSVTCLVTISADGTYEKKSLFEGQDTSIYFAPKITYKLNNNEFILWGVYGGENKFGVVKI